MLTEYKGQIFNAEIRGDQVNIWKYVPVAGFQRMITNRERIYYEKIVPLEDVKEFFNVTFLAFADERRFVITSLNGDNLNVLCDDREYAEAHGFTEIERGVWISKRTLDEFEKFQLVKSVENCNEKTVLNISKERLAELWKELS